MTAAMRRSMGGGSSTTIADPMTRAVFARDLGVGPREFAQLTRSEKKVYLEGLNRLNEKENEQRNGGERPHGKPRESDKKMVAEMEKEMGNQQAS